MKQVKVKLGAGLLSLLVLEGCRAASFRSAGPQLPTEESRIQSDDLEAETATIPISRESEPIEESFVLEDRPQIDIVWVVDNTGSMDPLIAKMQKHFATLYNSIAQRNDIRLAVVSAGEAGPLINGVPSFPRAAFKVEQALLDKGVVHLKAGVGNNNALALVSSAICPAATTDIGMDIPESPGDKICNVPRSNWSKYTQAEDINKPANWHDFTALKDAPASKLAFVKNAAGQLQGWYAERPLAKKILAMVSNDNLNGFGFPQYFQALQSYPGRRGFDKVFAFVHTDKTCMPEKIEGTFGIIVPGSEASPVALFGCLAPYGADNSCSMPAPNGMGGRSEVGTNYLKYIMPSPGREQITGRNYSICKDDWAPHFQDMTKVVLTREFMLSRKAETILKASIDGQTIDPSLIRIDGQSLSVDESLFTDKQRKLTVIYR